MAQGNWNTTVLVGQSGGPTAAINASLAGVYTKAHSLGARVLGMRYGIEGVLADALLDLDSVLEKPLQVQMLRHTPSSFLGSCRYKLADPDVDKAEYDALFCRFTNLGVGAVIYIGGNDSMDTIDKLSRYGHKIGSPIRFMGVPKTIDNDLVETDHTPGYGSAAKFVATTLKEIGNDSAVYALKSVTVVEIMGRDAGWLAASAALAGAPKNGGPDIILMPEAGVSLDRLTRRVSKLMDEKGNVVIAVSEGVHDEHGNPLCEGAGAVDAFGHAVATSGTCRTLAAALKERLHCKTRAIELSTLQRCSAHIASERDLEEAGVLGGLSVQAAYHGKTGKVSVIRRASSQPYSVEYGLVDVAEVANAVRHVPREWITEDGMGVTEDFIRYAKPLIAGEVLPTYVDGVPWHLRLQ